MNEETPTTPLKCLCPGQRNAARRHRQVSANQYRRQLDTKRSQRVDAAKKAAAHRSKESTKRAEAARARQTSANSKADSTRHSKLREAERKEREAATAGKEAARFLQAKASSYSKEEVALAAKLARAEQSERNAAERASLRAQQVEERRIRAEREAMDWRIAHVEAAVHMVAPCQRLRDYEF